MHIHIRVYFHFNSISRIVVVRVMCVFLCKDLFDFCAVLVVHNNNVISRYNTIWYTTHRIDLFIDSF